MARARTFGVGLGPLSEDASARTDSTEPLSLDLSLQTHLGGIGHQFLIDWMARETARHPRNRGAWSTLSQSYSALGRHAESCQANQKIVELEPDHPVAHYNLGCTRALLGDEAGALRSLQQAVDLGFRDANYLASDPDLVTLHDTPPFQALLRALRETSRPS